MFFYPKRVLIYLGFLLPAGTLCAQDPAVTLSRQIVVLESTHPVGLEQDTPLFRMLIDLGRMLIGPTPDSSLACADAVIERLTFRYEYELKNDSLLKKLLSDAYQQRGIIFSNRGDYATAVSSYQLALRFRKANGDLKGSANTHNNIGVSYKNEGNYPEAIRHHLEALKIREAIADSDGMGTSFNNIGSVYMMQHNFAEALRNYEQALGIREKIADRRGMAFTRNNIGNILAEQKDYPRALTSYLKALLTAQELGDKKLQTECYNNIGNTYFRQGLNETARNHFSSALTLQEQLGDKRGMVTTLKNLGLTFSGTNQFGEVIRYLDRAMHLSEQIHARDQQMNLYRDFATVYSQMGRHDRAFEFLEKYSALKDTLLSAEKNQQIAELQTRFETGKKDQEINLLNKERALKNEQLKYERTVRNTILFGSIMFFLLLILLVNRYRVLTEQRKKTERAEIEKALHELQMKALRSQMNPHFIFNCLNSVQRYILKNDKNNAVEYLQKFATLMRLILDNSEKSSVPLQDEVVMLDLYMHLEALRIDHGMDIVIRIDESLKNHDISIPSMILQPYVENAILHGIMHKETKGRIELEIEEKEAVLKCTITDNGIGRARAAALKSRRPPTHQSKGMSITQARVDIMNQMNRSSNSIAITDLVDASGEPAGTRVEVMIPIHQ